MVGGFEHGEAKVEFFEFDFFRDTCLVWVFDLLLPARFLHASQGDAAVGETVNEAELPVGGRSRAAH